MLSTAGYLHKAIIIFPLSSDFQYLFLNTRDKKSLKLFKNLKLKELSLDSQRKFSGHALQQTDPP